MVDFNLSYKCNFFNAYALETVKKSNKNLNKNSNSEVDVDINQLVSFMKAFDNSIPFKTNKKTTPNDFGFQKLCFPIKFTLSDNGSKTISQAYSEKESIEDKIVSANSSALESSNNNKNHKIDGKDDCNCRINIHNSIQNDIDVHENRHEKKHNTDHKDTDSIIDDNKSEDNNSNDDNKVNDENRLEDSLDSIVRGIKDVDFENSLGPGEYILLNSTGNDDLYAQHSKIYTQFMNSYIKGKYQGNNSEGVNKSSYDFSSTKDGKNMQQGDEVMGYGERKEYVKKVMMNAKFKSEINYTSEGEKKSYEYWKMTDSLNLFLSFLMYENTQLYQ